jgi:ATP-dependent DNA helicase PIF1
VEELKKKVFPSLRIHFKDHSWLFERVLMAPRNEIVKKVNDQLLQELPGVSKIYQFIDTVIDQDQANQCSTNFFNSLDPPGMLSHNLFLKIRATIMHLRYLAAPRLCNGTCLCVISMMPHVIEAVIMTGCEKRNMVIPIIPLIANDMPFEFKRLQFPAHLSFSMLINKAQGQSLKVAGLHLESPCFSHRQLYVACSRVGSAQNLYILPPRGKTKNVVTQMH